ncbi:RNA ligase/cyclic nucleotide phosphodiesterase [Artemisia annua]|uniref:U6 snRNA phosphodiesterase n=1 Tax=Artemisia annua TaxID=35608 RepID=A0A2U1NYG5_ARTAN|nr:RNA ligase/cyclic nucleotide phosphodiesterase [Artemisia annua]
MEALIASYGDTSSSDSDSDTQPPLNNRSPPPPVLPPPPIDLLNPPNSFGAFDYLERNTSSRIRSFPHIEGNYALHVYIPEIASAGGMLIRYHKVISKNHTLAFGYMEKKIASLLASDKTDTCTLWKSLEMKGYALDSIMVATELMYSAYAIVFIPSERKKELAQFLKKTTSLVQDLHVVDIDVPLLTLVKDEDKLIQAALGREFHISLGRTVPIRVHQIDSVVAMLKQKLQFQKRYLIDFNKWEVFVNDDQTRTFLSIENTSQGLTEVTKQIQVVNEVYKLHNLPEFYKDPRPHISIAWAVGDISQSLKRAVEGETKKYINVGGSSTRWATLVRRFLLSMFTHIGGLWSIVLGLHEFTRLTPCQPQLLNQFLSDLTSRCNENAKQLVLERACGS